MIRLPRWLRRKLKNEAGFSVVESLVVISLLSIASLGLTLGTITSLQALKRNKRSTIATQLCTDRLEQLAATNPLSFTTGTTTESPILREGISYSRATTITMNTDGSYSVTVQCSGTNSSLGGKATLSNSFPLWGAS